MMPVNAVLKSLVKKPALPCPAGREMPCRSFAHSPPLPLARTQAKNALANLLAAQPEAGIAKEKDVVAFERLLTEVAKRAAEADQAQTLLSDKARARRFPHRGLGSASPRLGPRPVQVFDNLFTYLSDNVTLWAPSESAKALDPDDGLLYSTLDVLLSASDSLPVPLAEACVEHLHSLARTSHAAPDRHVGARCSHLTPPPSTQVDIVMSTDLHPEAQELSADLINRALSAHASLGLRPPAPARMREPPRLSALQMPCAKRPRRARPSSTPTRAKTPRAPRCFRERRGC